jgi:hypothetical protein
MNFNGYELFNHIKNPALRTYNRVNTYINVKDRHGPEVGRKYLKKLDKNSQWAVLTMMAEIADIGYEQYRRNFMRERNA